MKDYIKYLRRNNGYSQQELAEAAGVTQSFISHLETGRNTCMTMGTMERLANALHVTPGEIFEAYMAERKNKND